MAQLLLAKAVTMSSLRLNEVLRVKLMKKSQKTNLSLGVRGCIDVGQQVSFLFLSFFTKCLRKYFYENLGNSNSHNLIPEHKQCGRIKRNFENTSIVPTGSYFPAS